MDYQQNLPEAIPDSERQILIFDGEKFVVGKYGDFDAEGADYYAEDPYYEMMHRWNCIWWAELPPKQ
jgi:hypothetical protein